MAQKLRKCRNCKAAFEPRLPLQSVCDYKCATEIAIKKRTSDGKKALQLQKRELIKEKKANKKRLIELEPLKYWEDKAQRAFNKWIVWRDREFPCISCGTTSQLVQYCAGHYRTRKAANQLRFDPDNVHKQCNNYCNMQNSGNITNYRPALIAKIGQERHDALINNHETKRWTKEECQKIELKYKELLKNERNL